MKKDYVLYASRNDFETHQAIGMFTRNELIDYVRENGLSNRAIVLENTMSGSLIPLLELEFLKQPQKTVNKPAPLLHPAEVARTKNATTSENTSSLFDQLLEAISKVPFLLWFPIIIVFFWVILFIGSIINPNGLHTTDSALERAEQKARTGRATEMTNAEADAFRRKQEADAAEHRATVNAITEAHQSRYSDRDLQIYRYMRRRFQSYGDSYNPSIHDDLIASEAASRFGVSPSQATNIYINVDSN